MERMKERKRKFYMQTEPGNRKKCCSGKASFFMWTRVMVCWVVIMVPFFCVGRVGGCGGSGAPFEQFNHLAQ